MDVMGPVLKQTPGQLPFTSDQRADLREKLHDIAGYGKRGGVPVLPPGVDIAFPGVMEDLDWPGLSMLSETRICAALGVPAMLVGVRAGVEHSTYSNHESARKGFFTTTMVSLWDTLDDALTKGLLRSEGEGGLEFRFLLDNIRELQEDETAKTARAAQAFTGGIITRNEARALIGQPKDDLRGDYYVMPAMNIEVPANREPEEALPADTSIPAEE
jgi:phage portal protein BeeE